MVEISNLLSALSGVLKTASTLPAAGAAQAVGLAKTVLPEAVQDHLLDVATLDQVMDLADKAHIDVASLLQPWFSRVASGVLAGATAPRPRPFSLWPGVPQWPGVPGRPGVPANAAPGTAGYVSDYTSWPALTRRDYSARHLPPSTKTYTQPAVGAITALFMRPGAMQTDRSSVFFMFFAQWFTDSFMRVDWEDKRRNTSNHDIDLCQIYGLHEGHTHILRKPDASGELRSQKIKTAAGVEEEFPDYLHEVDAAGGLKIKDIYAELIDQATLDRVYPITPKDRFPKFYATGLERGNSSIGYAAISTLFLREHNRIARELQRIHAGEAGWDGERIFQTARNTNIVLLLKIVTEVYISHVAGVKNLLVLEAGYAEKCNWYRTNWVAIEFDLLYRWHSLIVDAVKINGETLEQDAYRANNEKLERAGLARLVTDVSGQHAGKICLKNSPAFMAQAEQATIALARGVKLQSYNDYREQFGLARLDSFYALTDDPALQQELITLYNGDINKLEFVVGLYAEKPYKKTLFGKLMVTMVACDAVTHIFTNPLLSEHVFQRPTFTQYGWDLIEKTNTLDDLLTRNVPAGSTAHASFGIP